MEAVLCVMEAREVTQPEANVCGLPKCREHLQERAHVTLERQRAPWDHETLLSLIMDAESGVGGVRR